MRTSFFIISGLFLSMLATSSCLKCDCCGSYLAGFTCVKDSTYINQDGLTANQAQDSVNIYQNLGYTCTESGGLFTLTAYKVCGPIQIKRAIEGGAYCVDWSGTYGHDCEP